MDVHMITDKELIRQYIAGRDSAFEILLKRHKNKVFSYILYNIKDEQLANDIFQDTFIKVIRTLKKGRYNEEGKFLPWVNRIAHNLIIDYYRKSGKMPTVDNNSDFDIFSMIGSDDPSVESVMVKQQVHKDIKKLIVLLPKDQKEVLIMRIFCDMSFKEISERTNVSINTALGRMRYALINLRKMIKEKEISITY